MDWNNQLKKNQGGFAMLLVLWAMVLLIALGTDFAFSMRTEVNSTRNYKEDVQAYYLAKSGIQLAMAEILQKVKYHSRTEETGYIFGKDVDTNDEDNNNLFSNDLNSNNKKEEEDENSLISKGFSLKNQKKEKKSNSFFQDLIFGKEENEEESSESWSRTEIELGDGTVNYSISDENGKININTASREILVRALQANGIELGNDRDEIADSILDWIDADDNHRLNGVESNYYEGLNPPYKAKNAPLDSIDELLKIRGITKELVYGSPDYEEFESENENSESNDDKENDFLETDSKPGLARIFTVQNVPLFNSNTATKAALSVIYTSQQIEDIQSSISDKGFYNESQSTHFKVVSTGKLDDSETQHTIVAIIEKLGVDDKATLIIRYWKDNAFLE